MLTVRQSLYVASLVLEIGGVGLLGAGEIKLWAESAGGIKARLAPVARRCRDYVHLVVVEQLRRWWRTNEIHLPFIQSRTKVFDLSLQHADPHHDIAAQILQLRQEWSRARKWGFVLLVLGVIVGGIANLW